MNSGNFDMLMGTYGAISEMDTVTLISASSELYNKCDTAVLKVQLLALIRTRAQQIGPEAEAVLETVCREIVKADKAKQKEEAKRQAVYSATDYSVWMDLDKNGKPAVSIANFYRILTLDPHFSGLKYNQLKQILEVHTADTGVVKVREFDNAEFARSMRYIEENYNQIFSDTKFSYALEILQSERSYNPVIDILESLPKWDGVPRLEGFLHKWMGAEDTEYTREVSRLIFAGGINRLYQPGCKFDSVPVLIGTHQGEGKSSIIRWLAIRDEFFGENTNMESQSGIEQLNGAWIVEVAEMLSVTKASEQEAVKSFLSRQVDQYRRPYAKTVSRIPRACIFIGSSNRSQFLRDPTGARRFLPVTVSMTGHNLYQQEEQCKAEILLCWAEARDKYHKGELLPCAKWELNEKYREAQAAAAEDDFRIETIRHFLEKFRPGERVCARLLQREALTMPDDIPRDPNRKESAELALIMQQMDGWVKLNKPAYVNQTYNVQRCWEKVRNSAEDGGKAGKPGGKSRGENSGSCAGSNGRYGENGGSCEEKRYGKNREHPGEESGGGCDGEDGAAYLMDLPF